MSWEPPSVLEDTVELYLVSVGLDIGILPPPDQYSEFQRGGISFEGAQYLYNYEDNVLQPEAPPCGFVPFVSNGQYREPVTPPNETPPPDYGFPRRQADFPNSTDLLRPVPLPGPGFVPSGAIAPFGILVVNFTATNDTSHTFTGLCPFTTYNFSVSAVNRAGGGPYAQVAATTLEDGTYVCIAC